MTATLTISRPGKRRSRFELSPAAYVVGRDPALELCLNDTQASRQHAVLVVEPGQAWVRDLGSRNGVLVNGARLPDRLAQRLCPGDRIRIGRTELRYGDARPRARRRVSGRGQRCSQVTPARRGRSAPASRAWVPTVAVAASALAGILLGLLG